VRSLIFNRHHGFYVVVVSVFAPVAYLFPAKRGRKGKFSAKPKVGADLTTHSAKQNHTVPDGIRET
jgi:hypothetical protein